MPNNCLDHKKYMNSSTLGVNLERISFTYPPLKSLSNSPYPLFTKSADQLMTNEYQFLKCKFHFDKNLLESRHLNREMNLLVSHKVLKLSQTLQLRKMGVLKGYNMLSYSGLVLY